MLADSIFSGQVSTFQTGVIFYESVYKVLKIRSYKGNRISQSRLWEPQELLEIQAQEAPPRMQQFLPGGLPLKSTVAYLAQLSGKLHASWRRKTHRFLVTCMTSQPAG